MENACGRNVSAAIRRHSRGKSTKLVFADSASTISGLPVNESAMKFDTKNDFVPPEGTAVKLLIDAK